MIIDRIPIENLESKEEYLPWQQLGLSYTASGYGRKIPTGRKVKYKNRWRRVYCCISSNIGTCYITQGKNWIVVY